MQVVECQGAHSNMENNAMFIYLGISDHELIKNTVLPIKKYALNNSLQKTYMNVLIPLKKLKP